jgi:TolB protein
MSHTFDMLVPARGARLAAIAAAAAILLAGARTAHAQQDTTRGVRIGLTYKEGTRPGVVVLPVAGINGDSVRAILERDLDYGDRVTVVGGEAARALQPATTAGGRINYELAARLGGAAVLQVSVVSGTAHVVLHDVGAQRVMNVRDIPLSTANLAQPAWRLSVHAIADEVERWITGVRGVAATRIAYIRDRQVWVVDSDGENARAMAGGTGQLSPAWHPSGRYIAYTQFLRTGTQVLVRDLATGSARALVASPGGINLTPVFSRAEPELIAYAHGLSEGTDIVTAAWQATTPARRVTVGRGTENVGPTFSPDGRRMAFTSGRLGHPEVYITDVDGTNAELLTPYEFGDESYRSSPDWSPDGRNVAFQSRIGGRFQVMTISLRDRSVRQLTSDGANEDPSWAPDGRHVVFTSTRTGTRQLFVLDMETGRTRQLTRGSAARLAAWSPFLASAAAP